MLILSMKLTIGYTMLLPSSYEISFTLGNAIPLYDPLGNIINKKMIYDMIEQLVRLNGEKYNDAEVKGVFIRVYYKSKDSFKPLDFPNISYANLMGIISNVIMNSDIVSGNLPEVKSLLYKKSRIPSYISSIKGNKKGCHPFIVSNLETVVENNVNIPYDAGYLVVKPGDDLRNLPSYSIQTFLSENHINFYPIFEERSEKMFFEFFSNLEECVKNSSLRLRTVYFNNLGRFDGIFLLKYYVNRRDKYKIKPLLRNHKNYELKVYLGDRFLVRFRDSLTLMPSSLEKLGKTLCPESGSKESIPHEKLSSSNLLLNSVDLINYLRYAILILGGVMLKAQEINWSKYCIDIEDVMTLSSLSLKIIRNNFFDDNTFHINIPNRNQDIFIRRSYYGGHVDVYKPYGENLYYYDVNSLYPFIIKSYPIPCAIPVWKKNLKSVGLDSLVGFIDACVVCPTNISRPFFPYKDQSELKFARDLCYCVIPLRGYLFEKKSSPFEGCISNLYKSRLEAQKASDEAMTFIYKILMNSLYGRLGMNPESTVTEIYNQKKYEELMKMDNFQSTDMLSDHCYIE
ncbi:DNA polymerase-like [Mercurialis annua]|uniref:DNA polymerase-like n=1 Tax=Mercurialis annua TaxID=3986 RepID=UPI0021609781|nr:DNA polymerase-like [Mercurialis annua]